MLDYFGDDHVWLQANLQAAGGSTFCSLPGFWAEYGMCTEPSAFGAKCIWHENAFPTRRRSLHDYARSSACESPTAAPTACCPSCMRRLQRCRPAIEAAGHRIRFAVARGPLNIASYLLGHTEFLIGLKTNPTEIHRLLAIDHRFPGRLDRLAGGRRSIRSTGSSCWTI